MERNPTSTGAPVWADISRAALGDPLELFVAAEEESDRAARDAGYRATLQAADSATEYEAWYVASARARALCGLARDGEVAIARAASEVQRAVALGEPCASQRALAEAYADLGDPAALLATAANVPDDCFRSPALAVWRFRLWDLAARAAFDLGDHARGFAYAERLVSWMGAEDTERDLNLMPPWRTVQALMMLSTSGDEHAGRARGALIEIGDRIDIEEWFGDGFARRMRRAAPIRPRACDVFTAPAAPQVGDPGRRQALVEVAERFADPNAAVWNGAVFDAVVGFVLHGLSPETPDPGHMVLRSAVEEQLLRDLATALETALEPLPPELHRSAPATASGWGEVRSTATALHQELIRPLEARELEPLHDIDLPASNLLDITIEPSAMRIDAELVLHAEHPRFHPPRPGRAACIRRATLSIQDAGAARWLDPPEGPPSRITGWYVCGHRTLIETEAGRIETIDGTLSVVFESD